MQPSASPAFEPDGHVIDTDLCCVSCGYNLRTLAPNAICPECAFPVRQSIMDRHGADLKWLRSIHRGLTVLFFTEILTAWRLSWSRWWFRTSSRYVAGRPLRGGGL